MEENQIQQSAETLSEVLRVRREKLDELKKVGQDPFVITRFDKTHSSADILADFEKLEGQHVRIAGRLLSKRIMGKASFSHLQDFDGQIQLYVRKDVLGEEPYTAFKKLDIGDIIGVEGEVLKPTRAKFLSRHPA